MDIKNLPTYVLLVVTVVILLSIIAYLFYNLYRYKMQAIKAGLEDERIIKESNQKPESAVVTILSVAVSVLLFFVFAVSLYSGKTGNSLPIKGIGSVHLVGSGSMSYKNEANTYLEENNLNNQFNTYDLIFVHSKPLQEKLKLYDVVVYKNGNMQIVHRIVDTVDINGETQYITRGDSNSSDDIYPVSYDSIIGVYSNFKIPAVGIFVLFLQSPLGYIAMGLVLMAEFFLPVFEKKLNQAEQQRLEEINGTQNNV